MIENVKSKNGNQLLWIFMNTKLSRYILNSHKVEPTPFVFFFLVFSLLLIFRTVIKAQISEPSEGNLDYLLKTSSFFKPHTHHSIHRHLRCSHGESHGSWRLKKKERPGIMLKEEEIPIVELNQLSKPEHKCWPLTHTWLPLLSLKNTVHTSTTVQVHVTADMVISSVGVKSPPQCWAINGLVHNSGELVRRKVIKRMKLNT